MQIIYKDKDIVFINKAAGMPSQPDPTGDTDAMSATSAELSACGERDALWLVHRLDRVVGGVMVFARSKEYAARLSALISDKTARKEYLAVVEGRAEGGALTDLIYKDARAAKAFVVDRKRSGVKEARLEYIPLECVRTDRGEYTLVRVRLDTGRYHQIRVQLSHRGMPIVGDGKYGSHDNRAHLPALFSTRLSIPLGKRAAGCSVLPDLESYPWSLFSKEAYEKEFIMTEKLYYKDAYIKEFDARVISVRSKSDEYVVVLDRTAFFPEAGGQYADNGTIGGIAVADVRECDGVIYHHLPVPVEVGATVHCVIDFEERYEKMRVHTAEHILSGLFHTHYGLDNVGFHLGAEDVTMDISAPLGYDELMRIEELANRAVLDNLEVTAFFPTPEELPTLTYRSKLELTKDVRIVKIGDVDSCACCAPHVGRTSEVGSIKIIDFEKLRGGLRIHIAAGERALRYYRGMYENLTKISRALSAPKLECAAAVERTLSELESWRAAYKRARVSYFEREATLIHPAPKNLVLDYPDATYEELRVLANLARDRVEGMLVLLSGTEGDYNYVITSNSIDMRGEIKKINTALFGVGGGNSLMVQGGFSAKLEEIKKYFI
ncbi:MAG: hypothetical protein IJD51_00630 [Clostridia bacterium]|nr:hypothetical protein [Clostridia bacterium]